MQLPHFLGHDVTVRDAHQAYLHAKIHSKYRIETWVTLPQDYWPDTWFKDGSSRTIPLYRHPCVLLVYALYGHPESGALWESYLEDILKARGWTSIPEWPGVFYHKETGSILLVYVDDMILCCKLIFKSKLWASIEEGIEFKHEPAQIERFLGADYQMDEYVECRPDAIRNLNISMRDYVHNMSDYFHAESGTPPAKRCATPFMSDSLWSQESETDERFSSTCASHAATSLFASRVGRPDLSVITQRLCSAVSRWSTVHDSALVRMMAYSHANANLKLHGSLSPQDDDVVIRAYSDADWSGDPQTSTSTTGLWLELYAKRSNRCWPLAWGSVRQTSTSSSTAESETVAASHVLRREAIPAQLLMEIILGRRLNIELNIDNTQAILAIQRGYSKKLRHLARTQRVCIGLLHELLEDPDMQLSICHCPTLSMKADIFTKALNNEKFHTALEMIGMRGEDFDEHQNDDSTPAKRA